MLHPIIYYLGKIKNTIYCIINRGDKRYCPVCKKTSRKFLSGGLVDKRDDARCSCCGSYERYRFAWFYLEAMSNIFEGNKKILHVAPEKCFWRRIKEKAGEGYVSVDLHSPLAMKRMDIMDIGYPDAHFDVIYCNHVLEHVENDIQAMKEFYRVLKNNGWALIQVPINAKETFEDNTITDPQERLKVFGQTDHVRNYGYDFVDRLVSAGFKVKIIKPEDLFDSTDIRRMGVNGKYAGELFICTK